MTTLEFIIAFSIMPIGGLVIAAWVYYLTRRDAASEEHKLPGE
jgi:hypothetical protein